MAEHTCAVTGRSDCYRCAEIEAEQDRQVGRVMARLKELEAGPHVTTDPNCVEFREPRNWFQRRAFDRARGRACPTCTPRFRSAAPSQGSQS